MDVPSSSDVSSALATPPPLLATTPILQPALTHSPTHPASPPTRRPSTLSSEFHFLAPITRRSAPCSHLPPTSPVSLLLPASSLGVVGLLSCRRTWCMGYLSCSCLRRFDRFPPTNHTLTAPPCIPRTRTASLSPPPTSRVGFPRAPSFSRTPFCFASAALCLVERTASPRIAANSPRARRSPSPPMSSPRFTCAPFAYARTPRAHSPPARSRVSP
jgi:hypothetical protein